MLVCKPGFGKEGGGTSNIIPVPYRKQREKKHNVMGPTDPQQCWLHLRSTKTSNAQLGSGFNDVCFFRGILKFERIFSHSWCNRQLYTTVFGIINEFEIDKLSSQVHFLTLDIQIPEGVLGICWGSNAFLTILAVVWMSSVILGLFSSTAMPYKEAFPATLLRFGSVLPGILGGRKKIV